MPRLNNSIETYIAWCELMELNPSLVENVFRYQNLCKKMNRPRWLFKAKLTNGKFKSYITSDYPYKQLPKVLATALDNDIRVQVYRIDPDDSFHLIRDTELVKAAMEEDEQCFGS